MSFLKHPPPAHTHTQRKKKKVYNSKNRSLCDVVDANADALVQLLRHVEDDVMDLSVHPFERAEVLSKVTETADRIYENFLSSSAAAVVARMYNVHPKSEISWGVQVRAQGSGKTILCPSYLVKNDEGKGAVQWGPSALEVARCAIPSARKSTVVLQPPLVYKSVVRYGVLGLPDVLNGFYCRFEDPPVGGAGAAGVSEASITANQCYFQAARYHETGMKLVLGRT
jgi:hypothetical protein